MVALQKNLAAAADAHELMTECAEASGGIAGAHKGEESETEEDALQSTPENWFRFHG